MYDSKFWSDVISHVAWPITILIIVLLFVNKIKELIDRLKNLSYHGIRIEFEDIIQAPLMLNDMLTQKLSPEESEASRKRAQQRLDDDTKRAGNQRGELFKLENGRWAISWQPEVTVSIGGSTTGEIKKQ